MTELTTISSPLDKIQVGPVCDQASVDGAMRVLNVRQCIMNKILGAEEQKALMGRHEATIEGIKDKLEKPDLKPFQIKDMKARIKLARVKYEWCRQQVIQFQMEIDVYQKMLMGDN